MKVRESPDVALPAIYRTLYRCYGPQHWWPAETPLEMIVGAILTQSSAWINVEKAITNLKAKNALSIEALDAIPAGDLALLVYSSGYYNMKAAKIKAFVSRLVTRHGGRLDSLFSLDSADMRRELLSIHGIGEETADSIILYGAGRPLFVIDAYTRRIVARLGLAPAEENYAAYQALFMKNLHHDERLFNEYHALLVRHGKSACRKAPLCRDCCLKHICPAGS